MISTFQCLQAIIALSWPLLVQFLYLIRIQIHPPKFNKHSPWKMMRKEDDPASFWVGWYIFRTRLCMLNFQGVYVLRVRLELPLWGMGCFDHDNLLQSGLATPSPWIGWLSVRSRGNPGTHDMTPERGPIFFLGGVCFLYTGKISPWKKINLCIIPKTLNCVNYIIGTFTYMDGLILMGFHVGKYTSLSQWTLKFSLLNM